MSQQSTPATRGVVRRLAIRTAKNGPMREMDEVRCRLGGGIESDLPASKNRGVTLLAVEKWSETTRELGVDLPWHTRRANVLVEGVDLQASIGRRLMVGEVEIEVRGETEPCGLMDEQYPGLLAALTPGLRAGVHGRIIRGGRIRVGDTAGIGEAD